MMAGKPELHDFIRLAIKTEHGHSKKKKFISIYFGKRVRSKVLLDIGQTFDRLVWDHIKISFGKQVAGRYFVKSME